jgi:hypothetical protein
VKIWRIITLTAEKRAQYLIKELTVDISTEEGKLIKETQTKGGMYVSYTNFQGLSREKRPSE